MCSVETLYRKALFGTGNTGKYVTDQLIKRHFPKAEVFVVVYETSIRSIGSGLIESILFTWTTEIKKYRPGAPGADPGIPEGGGV